MVLDLFRTIRSDAKPRANEIAPVAAQPVHNGRHVHRVERHGRADTVPGVIERAVLRLELVECGAAERRDAADEALDIGRPSSMDFETAPWCA